MPEVRRTASRFDAVRGSAAAWVMTIAHRRAVDRVRAEDALDRQRVRRCPGGLTAIQAEAIKLAYCGGYTYPQVAELLGVALGTVKTRIRDGLIRTRDCMEVTR